MTVTGPVELLATWEAGLARRGAARAHLLHRAARPLTGDDALAALPVGARDADLFALRRALFGERMQVRLECAACDEAMEFDLDAGRFAERFAGDGAGTGAGAAGAGGGAAGAGDGTGAGGEVLRVAVDGWEIAFRPPTVADLTAAVREARESAGGSGGPIGSDGAAAPDGAVDADGAAGAGGGGARLALLGRCVVDAVHRGAPLAVADAVRTMPDSVLRALAETAERADPGADVTFGIACPACGELTRAELDIASYLWTELDAWARDVLLDVHLLASAYGWTEPEILALSPLRRRYYLELCADA